MDQRRRCPVELLRPEGNGSHSGPQVATAALARTVAPAVLTSRAEARFRRALALRPGRVDLLSQPCRGLALQGRYSEAEVPVLEFLRLSPRSPTAADRLGMVYVDQGRYGGAIPSYVRRSIWSHALRLSGPTWFARCSRPGRSEGGGGKARRRPWRPRPSRCRGRGQGARSPPRPGPEGLPIFEANPRLSFALLY